MISALRRIAFDILLIIALAVAPWWSVCALAALGAILFPAFAEAVILGAAMDALYGSSIALPAFPNVFLASFATLAVVIGVLRSRMR